MELNATIQGEGFNIGKPCFLYRMPGCNLNCPWCDTEYAKKSIDKEFNILKADNFIHELDYKVNKKSIINKWKFINTMIITGGEPFENIQKINYIYKILDYMYFNTNIKFIEFETNGSNLINLIPENGGDIFRYNPFFNVSPKLDVHCHKDLEYTEIESLYYDNLQFLIQRTDHYCVKIVYNFFDKDINEKIIKLILVNEIPNEKVIIMPFTPNKSSNTFLKNYHENCLDTIRFCKEYNFRYSPRIQIELDIK